MGEERHIAPCGYCEWRSDPKDRHHQAKRARAEHVHGEHEEERSITWHKDMPDLEVFEP